jgi:hypothetical protein
MPISVTKYKHAFEMACKKAKKLAKEKNCEYVVYWLEEYDQYRVTAQDNLLCFDNGIPHEQILYLAEP